jgi:hypothetical protein
MSSEARQGFAPLAGRRVQACDMGECEGATIMSEPQRGGADGAWQVLVLLDSRPDYLTPLGLNYLYLREPAAAAPDPVARVLAANVADRWRDECLRLRAAQRPVAQVVAIEPEGPDGHGVNWLAGKRPKPGDLLFAGSVEPLTDEQIDALFGAVADAPRAHWLRQAAIEIVRKTERAHGIT